LTRTRSALIIREAIRRKKQAVKEDIAAGRINLTNETEVKLTEQLLDLIALNYTLLKIKGEARLN
jgi:hypothetical protein